MFAKYSEESLTLLLCLLLYFSVFIGHLRGSKKLGIFVLISSYSPNVNEVIKAWVKVFRIILEFRILRLTYHRKSASNCCQN